MVKPLSLNIFIVLSAKLVGKFGNFTRQPSDIPASNYTVK